MKTPYVTKRTSTRSPISIPIESMVQQSQKDDTDINQIMAKYQKTGVLTHIQPGPSQFGEATGNDYLDAMMLIAEAKSKFNELPSSAREFFKNDPARFLDYCQDLDEDKIDKLAEFGMAKPTERVATTNEPVETPSPGEIPDNTGGEDATV